MNEFWKSFAYGTYFVARQLLQPLHSTQKQKVCWLNLVHPLLRLMLLLYFKGTRKDCYTTARVLRAGLCGLVTLALLDGPFSFSSLSSVSPRLLRSSALTLRSRWDTCQKATQPHRANSWARHTQFTAGKEQPGIHVVKGTRRQHQDVHKMETQWNSPCSPSSLGSWDPSCIWLASLLISPPSAIWSRRRRALRWSSREQSWSGDSARK